MTTDTRQNNIISLPKRLVANRFQTMGNIMDISDIISRLLEGKLPSQVGRESVSGAVRVFSIRRFFVLAGTPSQCSKTVDFYFYFQQCVVLDPKRICSYPKMKSDACALNPEKYFYHSPCSWNSKHR